MKKIKYYRVYFVGGNEKTVKANTYSEAINYCIDNFGDSLENIVDAWFYGYNIEKA